VLHWKVILILTVAIAMTVTIHGQTAKRRDDLKKPLVIASQGSFFVGGETKTLSAAPDARGFGAGDVTVNQMCAQYQIPADGGRHVPVVMARGCCLSSKTWETTPDGRMGCSAIISLTYRVDPRTGTTPTRGA
jgi:hypothetical protein